MLGRKNADREVITLTPEVSVMIFISGQRMDKVLKVIMFEAIRRLAGIKLNSEGLTLLRQLSIESEDNLSKLKVLVEAQKQEFVEIILNYFHAVLTVVYAGCIYLESLVRDNNYNNLSIDIFCGQLHTAIFELLAQMGLMDKADARKLGNRYYATIRMGLGFCRLVHRRRVDLSIVTYERALSRMPECVPEIAYALAQFALSEKGKSYAYSGKTMAALAKEVAVGLGNYGVWEKYNAIVSAQGNEALMTSIPLPKTEDFDLTDAVKRKYSYWYHHPGFPTASSPKQPKASSSSGSGALRYRHGWPELVVLPSVYYEVVPQVHIAHSLQSPSHRGVQNNQRVQANTSLVPAVPAGIKGSLVVDSSKPIVEDEAETKGALVSVSSVPLDPDES